MSFVPVTGPARLIAGSRPREVSIEFTDGAEGGRSVTLPLAAALPVLSRAHARDDAHPSVALLSGAVLLGLRLVAAGRIAPVAPDERVEPVEPDGHGEVAGWRPAALDDHDRESVRRLALARIDGVHDADAAVDDGAEPNPARVAAAEAVVVRVLEAVADEMPRAAPSSRARSSRPAASAPPASSTAPAIDRGEEFAARVRRRLAERAGDSRAPGGGTGGRPPATALAEEPLPELVRVSLRVEADEEELEAASMRLVLQVHDERDPLHVRDAAELWTTGADVHGFGPRARIHAGIALRAAAEGWPVLERFLDLAVPDRIELDSAEIAELLGRVGPLRAAGVDVHWPRSLGPALTSRVVLDRAPGRGSGGAPESPFDDSPFSAEGLFAFSWQLALAGEALSESEMKALAEAASPVVKLRGAWTVVDPTVAARARKRLIRRIGAAEALGAALTGVAELGPAHADDPADDDTTDAGVIVGASLLRVREQVLAAPTREPLPPPTGLRAELRGYQQHGLTWLADLTALGLGGCLADDMGLGKTITVIALHLHRRERGLCAGRPLLVVCPASLLGNWEAEFARFAPEVGVRRFHGGSRSLEGLGESVVLTTYGTLRSDVATLAGVEWDLVVADEAQHVKNSRTSTARALRKLSSRARVALTGTPVENELTELWSILDWAVPGLLGSRQAFRRTWAAPIESGVEPTRARLFAELIGPFLLRRRKSDPGIAPELPPKTETDHLLTLTREQAVLYETFVRDSMERIERADPVARRGLVLALLTGLKQICNHPAQFLRQSAGSARLSGRSQKLELLDELLDTVLAEDGAVLVFTQYVAMARLVEQHLAGRGVAHQFLHGGTPVAEREAMVARFQRGEVPVFLLSLKAGGTGLNLTRADHVVHLDRWWNPAVEEQATDRAYRIGQTRPVQVHRLVMRGTVEERVAELLGRKRLLADAVLARGEAALTELSDTELRDLVSLREEQRRAATIARLDAEGPIADDGPVAP